MSPLRADELFACLDRRGVRYVLIGGLAAVLHGSPLTTTDADVCPPGRSGEPRTAGRSARGARRQNPDAQFVVRDPVSAGGNLSSRSAASESGHPIRRPRPGIPTRRNGRFCRPLLSLGRDEDRQRHAGGCVPGGCHPLQGSREPTQGSKEPAGFASAARRDQEAVALSAGRDVPRDAFSRIRE